LYRLANTLVQRVPSEAHIVECDLEPCRPENAKEANVSQQVVAVGDGVVCGKGSEVGDEEEIEEELDAVGFVALGEDEGALIGADERGFDPRRSLMQTLQVLLLVAVRMLVYMLIVRPKLVRVHISLRNVSPMLNTTAGG
jgi:hypothetical protein